MVTRVGTRLRGNQPAGYACANLLISVEPGYEATSVLTVAIPIPEVDGPQGNERWKGVA